MSQQLINRTVEKRRQEFLDEINEIEEKRKRKIEEKRKQKLLNKLIKNKK